MTAETVAATRCGTYAGYQEHKRYGEATCDDCKRANREYQAARRRTKPDAREADRRQNVCQGRALWKLAKLHPGQFQALVQIELDAYDREARS